MSPRARLAAFALVVAAAFGLGFGVGDAAGPFDDQEPKPAVTDGHEHERGSR